MSDEPGMTDEAPDPLDAAYREAEARLDDDAARAARRARLLAAVAADDGAAPAPAEAPPQRPARLFGRWRAGGWLVAACVAGLGLFIAIQNYAPSFQPPPSAASAVSAPAAPTPTAPTPTTGQAAPGQVATAAPTADGDAASTAAAPTAPPPADQARLASSQAAEQAAAPAKATPSPAEPPNAQAERRDELATAPEPPPPPPPAPPPPATEAPRAFPSTPSPQPPAARAPILSGRNEASAPAPQAPSGYAAAGPPEEAEDAVRGGADHASNRASLAPDRGAALRDAAAAGRVADVEALLAQGTPVDAADTQGNTALMRSIQSDQPAVAAALRRHGASLDRRNHAGQSARDMAAARGDPALARAVGVGH